MTSGSALDPASVPFDVPADRYFSEAYRQLEWDRMWTRVWLLAADLEDLARVGDQATFDLGPESVLLARTAEGVRAHFNVCLHRGNRLCQGRKAHTARLRCPYHHWQYGLDGELIDLPDRDQFDASSLAGLRLRPVACATWGGFAWINLSSTPMPFDAYMGPLQDELSKYPLTAYRRLRTTTVEVPCNWKTWVDAVNEAYHVHTRHPQLLPLVDDVNVEITLYDRHSRHAVPFGVPSPRLPATEALSPDLGEILRGAGIDPASFSGGPSDVRPAIQALLRARIQRDADGARLDDRQLTDGYNYYSFPNTTFDMHHARYTLLRARPHSHDPERMFFDEWAYVRSEGEVKVDPSREFRYGEQPISPVLEQDVSQLVRVQQGMRSRGFDGLRLGRHERRIRHMHDWLDRYLETAPDPR